MAGSPPMSADTEWRQSGMIVAVGMDPTPDVDELVALLGEAQSAHADDWRTYWPYSTPVCQGDVRQLR